MNGYIAFWRGHKIEVYADTSYAAQQQAIEVIRQKHRPRGKKWVYEVSVVLAEKDGEQVTHVATN